MQLFSFKVLEAAFGKEQVSSHEGVLPGGQLLVCNKQGGSLTHLPDSCVKKR